MDELRCELERVGKNEDTINMHIRYLAFCYVNNITELATMISSRNEIYNYSYNYLLKRLIEYIQRRYNLEFINENTLMSYLDYYYGFE